MQHKRKTNHELFEEDRNKLAIGYRLSAIGYRLILGVLVSVFALQAQAACTFFDEFVDNKDGTVTDPRDGLIWKRCAEGSEFNGDRCSVAATKLEWFDAMKAAKNSRFLGKSDWRLPTQAEFMAVTGSAQEGCKNNGWGTGRYAASKLIAHSIDSDNWAGKFWSSSPVDGKQTHAWNVNFAFGNESNNSGYRGDLENIRLVRVNQSKGDKTADEFNRELSKIGKHKTDLVNEKVTRDKRNEEITREAERKSPARKSVDECNKYYSGKSIGFKPAGWSYFGATLDAVVLGKGSGNVSLKIVDRNFTDLYGKTLEMSCTSDQLQ